MQTQVQTAQIKSSGKQVTSITIDTRAYEQMPVPGFEGASFGVCFVRASDIPASLENYMQVNPRVPKRTAAGSLSGPIVKDILQTLREEPEEMALRNRGLFVLAESVSYKDGRIQFTLSDAGMHGVVDGSHTFACIREANETAVSEVEQVNLKKAFVRLHIVKGLKANQVLQIAAGMNTSKAVDDVSLLNLNGDFDLLRRSLRHTKAADSIAYSQGDTAPVPVADVLGYLSALDPIRFTEQSHAFGLYNRKSLAVRNFVEDNEKHPEELAARMKLLPDILELVDEIRIQLPEAVKRNGMKMGMMKFGGERSGSKSQKGTALPFTGKLTDYKIPQAWVLPVLSAFRANLIKDKFGLGWRCNPKILLGSVVDDMAAILLSEYKLSGGHLDQVGKRPAAYRACFDRVQLFLAKKRLL